MRKTFAASAFAPRFCLCVVFTILSIAGCGTNPSTGSTGGGTTTTVTSVTVAPGTGTVTAGNSLPFAATVAGANNPSQLVNWTVSPTTAGTITTGGVFTSSSTINVTTTATITAASTVPGYTNITGSATFTINPVVPTVTSVTVAPGTGTVTAGNSLPFAATVAGANNPSQLVNWTVSPTTAGTITTGGVFTSSSTINVTTTATITAASTVPGYTNITGSATFTINPVVPTVTSVSLACSPSSISDVQTTSCTPTVTGTGAFTNTVNLSVSPASAGTLSATSGVSSGTAITFTPAFTGAATPTITAVSTADSTKSGVATVTVTLRTITINSSTGNIWTASCFGQFPYTVTQTGIVQGDTFHLNPAGSSVFTNTPGSTFTEILLLNSSGNNLCSPGADANYVTGTDGAQSSTHYVPVIDRWNMWAGNNTTDEFLADYAAQTTCPYKLGDGSSDGACFPNAWLATIVDGSNLVVSTLGNGGIGVYNIATTAHTNSSNRSGDNIVGVAAKNGIIGYTTNQEVSFFLEAVNSSNIADVSSVGIAPSAIAMSTGCSSDPNTASAFTYDEASPTLYRSDAVKNSANGMASASRIGSVPLSGFSLASSVTNTLARYVVAWDNTCRAAVLAPVATGTNPDGSTAYAMELALVDMTVGTMRQLGTYVASGIPSTAIRMAADPTGNDVIIASTNESAGTTILTKASWTLDANENPTFTVTTLNSAPPAGIYGVSLGVLPNGKISVGQRQQHVVLAAQ